MYILYLSRKAFVGWGSNQHSVMLIASVRCEPKKSNTHIFYKNISVQYVFAKIGCPIAAALDFRANASAVVTLIWFFVKFYLFCVRVLPV